MTIWRALGAAGMMCAGLLGCSAFGGVWNMFSDPQAELSRLKIPYSEGELVTLWSWGLDRPESRRIVIISGKKNKQRFALDGVDHVCWLPSDDLLVEQAVPSRYRLLRIKPSGEILSELKNTAELSYPELSPDGHWLAGYEFSKQGLQALEIKDFSPGFKTAQRYDRDKMRLGAWDLAWSSDSSKIVIGIDKPDRDYHLWPVLAILAIDRHHIEYPAGRTYQEQGEPAGIRPLFWIEDGIYGKSDRGLIRCDPHGGGCELVYFPGEGKLILSGTPVTNGQALLLVIPM